jgi:hypothetical protein
MLIPYLIPSGAGTVKQESIRGYCYNTPSLGCPSGKVSFVKFIDVDTSVPFGEKGQKRKLLIQRRYLDVDSFVVKAKAPSSPKSERRRST